MLQEFKTFLLRGNLVDLAVAFVIGLAFAAVIGALVQFLINPLIALIVGQPDLSGIDFTISDSRFGVGDFLNAAITFVATAAAVFFVVVKPYEAVQARRVRGEEPEQPAVSDEERRHQELLAALRERKNGV